MKLRGIGCHERKMLKQIFKKKDQIFIEVYNSFAKTDFVSTLFLLSIRFLKPLRFL
jgi:hypothetical protein